MNKPSIFFCSGEDEFIVNEQGRSRFEKIASTLSDDFNAEIIEGNVNNLDELKRKIGDFASTVRTLSMFGDKKLVWLRGVNFMGESAVGRSEGAKKLLEQLQEILISIKNPNEVEVIITANSVDRRKSFYKWLKNNVHFEDIVSDKRGASSVEKLIRKKARALKLILAEDAVQLLLGRLNGDARMSVNELEKLSVFLGKENVEVTYDLINKMVPSFGEGNQFETVEEFYSLNIKRALNSLRRHFFFNRDARMLLSGLTNQNRLMIQLRTLMDSGILKAGFGLNQKDLNEAAEYFSDLYEGISGKSNLNVFSQHPYYLSRLIKIASKPQCKLPTLIRFNQVFIEAFEQILAYPNNAESILRDTFVRCLHRGEA